MAQMIDPLTSSILLFSGSCALGYAVTKAVERLKPVIPVGARVRIRMASGVARSILVAQRSDEWVFGALLQRFAGELPSPGDSVLVEAVSAKGAYLFRVRVKYVDREPFALSVSPPADLHRLDRRQERRVASVPGAVHFNACAAEVIDLSSGGIKLLTDERVNAGDRAVVTVGDHNVDAWVLDARPFGNGRMRVRCCFDRNLT